MKYSEKLYAHKYDNLDKMDQFLERCNLSKLTVGEIDHQKKPKSNKLNF